MYLKLGEILVPFLASFFSGITKFSGQFQQVTKFCTGAFALVLMSI